MKVFTHTLIGVSVLAVSQAMCLSTAAAQDVASDQAVLNGDTGEIIVTAQRRNERLQDVPISMAVIGGADLASNQIATAAELAHRIPNFSITRTPGGLAVTMRGVGASTASPSLEQSIVTFVDGVYGGNNRQFQGAFLDVGQIEVLRGPQGALVGKNTVAGAINILTRRPTDEFSGYIDANYDFLLDGPTIEGALNVPLGGGFAMRFAGRYADLQGYVRNVTTNRDEPTQEEYIGRVTLGYDNGGPVTAFIKYEHSESDGVGTLQQIISPSTPGYELDYRKFSFASDRPETNIFNTDNLVAQFDFDLDWATLTSITAYSGFDSQEHLDSDFTPVNGGISDFNMKLDQFSQELRLVSSTEGNFDYAVGALFQIADLLETRTTGILVAPNASTYRIMDQETKDISFYGQLGYDLGQFRIQGSLRYSNVRKKANYKRFQGPQALQYTGNLVRNFNGELENDLWDPSITLQYRPNSRMMFYASYQHGSKGGGFQGAIANAEAPTFVILPESAESYEAGAKLSFGGGSYFNLAAFHTTYTDLQVSAAVLAADGLSAPFFVSNAGSARVIGVEFDSLLRISPVLDLLFNGAWNPEAKFTSFRSGPCPIDGSVVPPGANPGSCDLTDLRLPYSPKFQATATATYKQPIGDSLLFTASGTAIYRGDARQATDLDRRNVQEAFWKFDARVAIGAIDGRWELGVVGRNLTDKLTINSLGVGGFSATVLGKTDVNTVGVAPPRQILATASFKF